MHKQCPRTLLQLAAADILCLSRIPTDPHKMTPTHSRCKKMLTTTTSLSSVYAIVHKPRETFYKSICGTNPWAHPTIATRIEFIPPPTQYTQPVKSSNLPKADIQRINAPYTISKSRLWTLRTSKLSDDVGLRPKDSQARQPNRDPNLKIRR